MSDVPDPECFLRELKGSVYQTLTQKLKKDESWRKLASTLKIFDEEDLEQKSCPSSVILNELDIRMCRVKTLRTLLVKCELREAAAVLSEPVTLSIETQPGDSENDIFVSRGEELQLEVEAIGVPPPRYLWYRDNEELLNQKKSVLRISDFGPQMEGEYKCLVSQDSIHGYCQEFSAPVNVLMLPEPPNIEEQPQPVSVRVGEEVILSCKAFSHPPPRYEWMRDNTILIGENCSILKIPHASVLDSGIYKCCVSNGYNEKTTEGVKLFVYESPIEQNCRRSDLPIVQEKVALLIANAAYDNLSLLQTPYNDVKAFSTVLQKLGFKVLSLCDLTLTEMTNAVKTFCDLIPEGAYAIVYFAGHGFELHDKYMLPIECPTPDVYLRSHSLSESHVIKEVLEKKPHLLLLMLDMCLKLPKREENPGMYDEPVVPIPYKTERNLLRAYATTSNLGAYEERTEMNGIYMKHLLKFIEDDMPIVDILQNVIESVSKEASDAKDLQMPSFTSNVVPNKHYLTAPFRENRDTKAKYDELTQLQNDGCIYFPEVKQWAILKFRLFQNCFLNAIEVHFYNLQNWKVYWDTQSVDINFLSERVEEAKVLIVLHVQKLKTASLSVTVSLKDDSDKLVDNALFEINPVPIAFAHLWFKPPVVVDQSEESILNLSYESSGQCVYSEEVNTGS